MWMQHVPDPYCGLGGDKVQKKFEQLQQAFAKEGWWDASIEVVTRIAAGNSSVVSSHLSLTQEARNGRRSQLAVLRAICSEGPFYQELAGIDSEIDVSEVKDQETR
jgi:hypothetical protein